MLQPRGLRNCNPLNIKRTADLWQGLAEEQPDPTFFSFKSVDWGYRAAFVLMRTYINKYRLTTVEEIIQRWAPPGDNNDTAMYIRMVCCLTGFGPDTVLNPYNEELMIPLVAAMARVECGRPANLKDVCKGWQRYLG